MPKYTARKKNNVLKALSAGGKAAAVARRFKIDPQTVRIWANQQGQVVGTEKVTGSTTKELVALRAENRRLKDWIANQVTVQQ